MNTVTVDNAMFETMSRLADAGWRVTNAYADAVIRMDGKGLFTHGAELYVFVAIDGSISRPMTHETSLATIKLREEGFVIR